MSSDENSKMLDKFSTILKLLTELVSEKNCQCKVRELLDKVDFDE